MYRDIVHAVYKRGEASMGEYQMPGWAWAIFFADMLVFLPLFLLVSYSLQHIFPTLAIIEDPSPAYEPVSLNEDNQSFSEDNAPVADEATGSDAPAVTSSFRGTYRTLTAVSGWRSMFRGLGCWVALSFATMFVYSIFTSVWVPALVAAPLSAITLVQFYTAWTHIVISAPSPKRFWQRLPPFKKAFQATALPICLYLFAVELSSFLPKGLAYLMGMNMWDPKSPNTLPEADANDAWKGVLVLLTTLVLHIFLVIPTQVVLTRVQASLLPEEDDTIVPFDRSFQGKVEPAIVGGKGFVSIMDAWKTFSRASWMRLVKLYVKIFAVGVAMSLLWMAVLVPEILLIWKHSQKVE
ncbi:Uu.00g023170.m01.CDS01 [Anthostomella pinea]|uniref:Uu.00g023170.m01.CDS01 n=1 Tax=Anthostomella pinea TaxID=933095 RepID=A0AAI8W012_9PEZI|nr:Uu.00g023170.m01.CDS01 [Anthostomella pinea]